MEKLQVRTRHKIEAGWQQQKTPVTRSLNLTVIPSTEGTGGRFSHIQLHANSAWNGGVRLAVCLTVYNEPLDALTSTLESVLLAIQRSVTSSLQGQQTAKKACVALMLDGPEKTHPSVWSFLCDAGLVADDEFSQPSFKNTRFYYSRLRDNADTELATSALARWEKLADSVNFVVCVKDRNRGKLHSHALFFGTLCAIWQPDFCFQIDVGTVIEASAIEAMLLHFDRMPEAGGLASRVVSPVPLIDEGFLGMWQYVDFATQAAIFWPAEIVSGHLSFLPGQFCALRWAALSGRLKRIPFQTEEELQQACHHNSRRAPLDGYLHGIGASTAMEKIMFLSEDRILGNEIILAEGQWQLDFCSAAHTTTDACKHDELLRQRRRWNNSSTACKFRILGQWPSYLKQPQRSIEAKLRFSLAMLWQIMVILQQSVAPAMLGCTVILFGRALRFALAKQQWQLPCAILLFSALAVGSTLLATRAKDRKVWLAGMRDASFMALAVLMLALLSGTLPLGTQILLYLPMTVAIGLTCRVFPDTASVIVRRCLEYFLFVNPVMQVHLWVYSILHINDVTWGTKGLTAALVGRGREQADLHREQASQMRRVRNVIGTLWVILNASLLYIAANKPALYFTGLNPVLEVFCGLFVITLTMAVGLHGVHAWRNRALAMRGRNSANIADITKARPAK